MRITKFDFLLLLKMKNLLDRKYKDWGMAGLVSASVPVADTGISTRGRSPDTVEFLGSSDCFDVQ